MCAAYRAGVGPIKKKKGINQKRLIGKRTASVIKESKRIKYFNLNSTYAVSRDVEFPRMTELPKWKTNKEKERNLIETIREFGRNYPERRCVSQRCQHSRIIFLVARLCTIALRRPRFNGASVVPLRLSIFSMDRDRRERSGGTSIATPTMFDPNSVRRIDKHFAASRTFNKYIYHTSRER